MQTQVTDNGRLEAAFHQAKTALRAGLRGQQEEKARATNRMYDTLEACQYPYFTTSRLIKRLGHKKSVVLGLGRPLIDLALKMEWS
jgi:hypothetical protein